jgi:hypothetical protein
MQEQHKRPSAFIDKAHSHPVWEINKTLVQLSSLSDCSRGQRFFPSF